MCINYSYIKIKKLSHLKSIFKKMYTQAIPFHCSIRHAVVSQALAEIWIIKSVDEPLSLVAVTFGSL